MSDGRDLYQALILDHSKNPRNRGPLEPCTHSARADNPLCGDRVTVHLDVADDRIRHVRFEGRGCAISIASASLLTTLVEGRSLGELDGLRADLERAISGDGEVEGELGALTGVRRFPSRRRCATLAWEALDGALGD